MPPTRAAITLTFPAHYLYIGIVLRWDTWRTRARRNFPYAVPALPVCLN